MFDSTVARDEVHLDRPEPHIYVEAATRLRVDPTHCLVFEDSETGIEGAKQAGMYAAAVGPTLASRVSTGGGPLDPTWILPLGLASFDLCDIKPVSSSSGGWMSSGSGGWSRDPAEPAQG